MIYTPENSKGLRLMRANGKVIKFAYYFDDETGMTWFYDTEERNGATVLKLKDGVPIKKWDVLKDARMVKL